MSAASKREIPICTHCGGPAVPNGGGTKRRYFYCFKDECRAARRDEIAVTKKAERIAAKSPRYCAGGCGTVIPVTRRADNIYCSKTCTSFVTYRRLQYGLSPADIEEMFVAQDGKCAACLEPLDRTKGHIDHCHDTGTVRGLLHPVCNQILGMVYENPMLLRRLADFAATAQMLKIAA